METILKGWQLLLYKQKSPFGTWTSNPRSRAYTVVQGKLWTLRNTYTLNVEGQISQPISEPNGGHCVYYTRMVLKIEEYHLDSTVLAGTLFSHMMHLNQLC